MAKFSRHVIIIKVPWWSIYLYALKVGQVVQADEVDEHGDLWIWFHDTLWYLPQECYVPANKFFRKLYGIEE